MDNSRPSVARSGGASSRPARGWVVCLTFLSAFGQLVSAGAQVPPGGSMTSSCAGICTGQATTTVTTAQSCVAVLNSLLANPTAIPSASSLCSQVLAASPSTVTLTTTVDITTTTTVSTVTTTSTTTSYYCSRTSSVSALNARVNVDARADGARDIHARDVSSDVSVAVSALFPAGCACLQLPVPTSTAWTTVTQTVSGTAALTTNGVGVPLTLTSTTTLTTTVPASSTATSSINFCTSANYNSLELLAPPRGYPGLVSDPSLSNMTAVNSSSSNNLALVVHDGLVTLSYTTDQSDVPPGTTLYTTDAVAGGQIYFGSSAYVAQHGYFAVNCRVGTLYSYEYGVPLGAIYFYNANNELFNAYGYGDNGVIAFLLPEQGDALVKAGTAQLLYPEVFAPGATNVVYCGPGTANIDCN